MKYSNPRKSPIRSSEVHRKVNNSYPTYAAENRKFNADGSRNDFPGSTIVCDLTRNETVMQQIAHVQAIFRRLPFAARFALLPPESVHMTVFELLCDHNREQALWSRYLSTQASLEDTDVFLAQKWQEVDVPESFAMTVDGFDACRIWLRPADPANAERLRQFRDRLAEVTGVKFPNHDRYRFHITFAYVVQPLTPEEERHIGELCGQLTIDAADPPIIVHTGPAIYTVFRDVSRYVPFTPEARALLEAGRPTFEEE